MDGLCMLYPPKCKFMAPFKWQKKKRTNVQDAIVIQAENNNISPTEFSNVSGHFMEDVYKHTTSGFLFLLRNYSRTSRYGHLSNTHNSILWTVSNVLAKCSYIFSKKNLTNTDSLKYGQRTLNLGPRE